MTKNDFYSFGGHCKLSKSSCQKIIGKLVSLEDAFVSIIKNSILTDESKDKFIKSVKDG